MRLNKTEPGKPNIVDKHNPNSTKGLTGLHAMETRLHDMGGCLQQDRMIKEKNRTLQRAIKYSYQGAKIKKVGEEPILPGLINPDRVTHDYDDKILSTGYEFKIKPGDVFEWVNTGTIWLVTTQELTELAYFKAKIRRCNYSINWQDEDTGEVFNTYVALIGPAQNTINSINKVASIDIPNHQLTILMPKNPDTVKFFTRYARFYLQGIIENDKNTCWRVTGTDTLSTPGVLQIHAEEYYSNLDKDDLELGVANSVDMNVPPESDMSYIEGPDEIRPNIPAVFIWKGRTLEPWYWDETAPLKVTVEDRVITVKWIQSYSGKFTLTCGDVTKEIRVKSLF